MQKYSKLNKKIKSSCIVCFKKFASAKNIKSGKMMHHVEKKWQ